MQAGTEPWVVLKTISGVFSEVIALFSLYYGLKRHRRELLVGLSLLAPVLGEFLWQYLCRTNHWPFSLGGPRNEPYGFYAIAWGVVALMPVIFAVRLLTSEQAVDNIAAVGRWLISRECALVIAYLFLAGLCCFFFYGVEPDCGVRAWVTSFGWPAERTEQLMILLWASTISAIPTLALLFLGGKYAPNPRKAELLLYTFPAVITVTACLVALAGYFALFDYINLDQQAQIRGLMAGLVVRFSLFWGLWLTIDTRNFLQLAKLTQLRLRKPFPTSKPVKAKPAKNRSNRKRNVKAVKAKSADRQPVRQDQEE